MPPFPTAKHLASVLADPNLYASILDLDSKEMAELSLALSDALNVAKYAIYTRCHPEEATS